MRGLIFYTTKEHVTEITQPLGCFAVQMEELLGQMSRLKSQVSRIIMRYLILKWMRTINYGLELEKILMRAVQTKAEVEFTTALMVQALLSPTKTRAPLVVVWR